MKNSKSFYITTAIPYVNARPHIGHALEYVQTDVIARYYRQQGRDVRFLSGSDENALKNVQAAEAAGKGVEEFIAENTEVFQKLLAALAISNDDFICTSAEDRHIRGAKKLWSSCRPEDIYTKKYQGLYCVGCEEFKLEKDLVNGECPEHPGKKLEEVEEENYFFKLSKYQDQLQKLIKSGELAVIPESRKNETLAFIEGGLEDFSISRSRERAHNWGVEVPNDPSQVMYVWFDALSNYITALGYADNNELFKKYWEEGETLHVIGKGINRFHTIYWPAMLLSAGVALPKKVFIHGYITANGQKMSKSIGNVIDPFEAVEKYGVDPVRYYLLREIPAQEDGDFSYEKFEERYNGELANGIGNLVARVATLGEKVSPIKMEVGSRKKEVGEEIQKIQEKVANAMEQFRFSEALGGIWELIGFADKYINDNQPWKIKNENELKPIIANAAQIISTIADLLEPFLPGTVEKIREQIFVTDSEIKIKRGESLFPRLNK